MFVVFNHRFEEKLRGEPLLQKQDSKMEQIRAY